MAEIERSEYPIFCGRVIKVAGIIEEDRGVFTVVDYMTQKDEPTEKESQGIMFSKVFGTGASKLLGHDVEKKEESIKDKIKRASIPMRLEASVIEGAEIRTRFGQFNLEECGEGKIADTYEVEVIKGRSQAGMDGFSLIAELADGPRHTGFKYIKILKTII